MALLDAVAKSVSKTLIGKFGKTMTLRIVFTEADVSDGTSIETEPFGSPFTVQGIVSSFDLSRSDATFDGVVIKSGDLKVTIPAQQVTTPPRAGATLFFPEEDTNAEDVEHVVQAVRRKYGGDDVYAYELLVRR